MSDNWDCGLEVIEITDKLISDLADMALDVNGNGVGHHCDILTSPREFCKDDSTENANPSIENASQVRNTIAVADQVRENLETADVSMAREPVSMAEEPVLTADKLVSTTEKHVLIAPACSDIENILIQGVTMTRVKINTSIIGYNSDPTFPEDIHHNSSKACRSKPSLTKQPEKKLKHLCMNSRSLNRAERKLCGICCRKFHSRCRLNILKKRE